MQTAFKDSVFHKNHKNGWRRKEELIWNKEQKLRIILNSFPANSNSKTWGGYYLLSTWFHIFGLVSATASSGVLGSLAAWQQTLQTFTGLQYVAAH